jgi:hypothetical protein
MRSEARFRVSHPNEHWMVMIPLNDDAKRLIKFKAASLRPNWSPEANASNPEEEKREIIRKANALLPGNFHRDPLI